MIRPRPLNDATAFLTQAQTVVDRRADPYGGVSLAGRYNVSARYLVAARDLDVKPITEDAKLRAAAPKLTQSLADAVGC